MAASNNPRFSSTSRRRSPAISKNFLPIALVFFASAGSAVSGAVKGVTYARQGASRLPLSRVYVTAHSMTGDLLGTARTDREGNFELVNLPLQRMVLTAYRPGYYTHLAAGRAGSRITLDCSAGCAEVEADFELIRAAVISGVVIDRLREPIAHVRISARRVSAPANSTATKRTVQAVTDDRGRFRLGGLQPGTYTVSAQGKAPALPRETRSIEVELEDGEQIDDLIITFGSQAVFHVSGVLEGFKPADGARTQIRLEGTGGSRRNFTTALKEDGSFQFPAVTEGRYLASATIAALAARGIQRQFLDVIDLRGNIEGLVLRPAPTATADGSVEMAAGKAPSLFQLRFTSNEGFGSRGIRVPSADSEFTVGGLVPGSYRVEARSPLFYVKGVRQGDQIVPAHDVSVSPGGNHLDVVVAADHGEVYGTTRALRTGRPLPHARVALEGPTGKLAMQSDQFGRFHLGKVVPGEYRICAWADIAPEEVEEERRWEQASCTEKIIPVDPDSRVEIDLTAAP